MSKLLRVLIVEDSDGDALLMIRALKKGGYNPVYQRVETAESMKNALEKEPWDVILCDYQMPQFNGLAAIEVLKETGIDIPLIIVSGAIGEETAVECMRSGALDFFMKGKLSRLASAVERELKDTESRRQRKQAEDALKKSQSLLTETEKIGKVGGWEFNIDTGKQIWTEEIYHIHEVNLTYDPTVEKGINFYTPASRPIIEQAVRRAVEHGEPFNVELEIITAKGNLRSVQAVGKADSEHRRIYGFFQDITNRKRAENDLKEALERLNSLTSYVDSVYLVDRDCTYLFMNERHLKRFGLSLDEVVGKKYSDFHSEEDTKRLEEVVNEVCETCKEITKEHQSERDGKYFLRTFTPIVGQNSDEKVSQVAVISKDITNIKSAEKELSTAMQHLTAHIDNSPLAVIEFDSQFRIIRWSKEAERVFGWTSEEVLGRAISEIRWVYEEDEELVRRESADLLRGEKSRSLNVNRNYRKDGSVIYCEWYNSGIYESDGKLISIQSLVLDITDRKKTEEALRTSEEQHRAILRTAMDGIWLLDMQGCLLEVNQTYCRMSGYSEQELLAMCVQDLDDVETENDTAAHIQKVMAKGEDRFESRHRRKDGTIYDVEVSIQYRPADGGLMLAFLHDITERKQAELDLIASEQRLRKAIGTTIQVMVSAVESRDPYTSGHQIRSADLARAIANEMGLPQHKIDGIRMAGSIHDIGKLSIPAEILSKPTKLTAIELLLIKEHAGRGYEILKGVESPWPLAEIVYQHHERMDGSGYPRNLKGEEICMEARILAVADVVEAMASHRPYRAGLGIAAALEEIEKNSGIFYDTAVADACLKLFREKGFKLEGA